jgi:hypothetical protein
LYGGLRPYVAKDLPKDASQERYDKVAGDVSRAIERESGFYGKKGMPAGLPVHYCRPDKGFAGGKVHDFIAPNEDRLRMLGVRLHAGHKQSEARLSEFNSLVRNPIILF